MMDGELELADYRAMKGKPEPEIECLERGKSKPGDRQDSKNQEVIEHGFYFLQNLPELFTSADLEGKYRFLGSTFSQKIVFEAGEVRTSKPHPILTLKHKPGKAFSTSKRKHRRLPAL